MVEPAHDPLVAVRGLSVHFRLGFGQRAATVRAVDGVDFDIARGEVLGLSAKAAAASRPSAARFCS
jgi:ABC-type glutathione transport system ATPase component